MEDRAKVIVLPPLIPLSSIGTGFLIHLVLPIPIATAAVTTPVGIFLVVVSILLVVAAAYELAKARTAFDVRKPTTTLVHRGVFRLSRNPVYFSMLLLCVGVAFLANSAALLALSFPAGSALCLLVIRKEEHYLEQKFGSTYRAYKSSVRRWI
ncbi:MAG TPA: isoprenylcysteine carboxylmethyltransferase family protein [Terriglobia bacterium]|nr:isoprenylcysteine carboxylmethyltransferase family protein [Terriglobia bacterium]